MNIIYNLASVEHIWRIVATKTILFIVTIFSCYYI